jgi:hypothetical protein
MFQWDKSINAINIPANKVVHLFRSMREVQLALPGIPAQQASAFLCQYQTEGGVGTVSVFHFHKSQVLAFYPSVPLVVPEQKVDSMLDQGLNFVESMGFLLTDQDIHLLEEADQEMLWSSLPLKSGLVIKEEAPEVEKSVEKPQPDVKKAADEPAPAKQKTPFEETVSKQSVSKSVAPSPEEKTKKEEPEDGEADGVDDLLAAVEAMRAKRPGLRARKLPPTAEEMDRRKQQLRETIGRILVSL